MREQCSWELEKGASYTVGYKNCYCREHYRVVGFEVEPSSIDRSELQFEGEKCRFRENPKRQAVQSLGTTLYFTYSVKWKSSNVEWASRWDIYLSMRDVDIHWFSILNSLVVVFFLSGKKPRPRPLPPFDGNEKYLTLSFLKASLQ